VDTHSTGAILRQWEGDEHSSPPLSLLLSLTPLIEKPDQPNQKVLTTYTHMIILIYVYKHKYTYTHSKENMPNKTIYIRNQDLEAWEAIQDKPRFIADALRSVNIKTYNKAVEERKELEAIIAPYLEETEPEVAFCKNGHVIPEGQTKCSSKGCKYAG
jgi:hypothetical protein